MLNVSVIIPAYNPDGELLRVINELKKKGFNRIIIIDDGSLAEYRHIFQDIEKTECCIVLRHSSSLGRGRALKTAFNYVLENCGDDMGVVTSDAAGNYGINDIIRCVESFENSPENLVLGVRDFNNCGMPRKNRFGNKTTAWILKYFCGVKVSDAQTALRVIPIWFVKELMTVSGERFDFETNMLLKAEKLKVTVNEIQLEEYRYSDRVGNAYYDSALDSLKVFGVIMKYISSSLACSVVDIALFWVLNIVFNKLDSEIRLFWSTAIARSVSLVLNFLINRNIVFMSGANTGEAAKRYFIMSIVKMMLSYGGTYLLTLLLKIPETVSKILIDGTLGIMSFKVQKEWVFKKSN